MYGSRNWNGASGIRHRPTLTVPLASIYIHVVRLTYKLEHFHRRDYYKYLPGTMQVYSYRTTTHHHDEYGSMYDIHGFDGMTREKGSEVWTFVPFWALQLPMYINCPMSYQNVPVLVWYLVYCTVQSYVCTWHTRTCAGKLRSPITPWLYSCIHRWDVDASYKHLAYST